MLRLLTETVISSTNDTVAWNVMSFVCDLLIPPIHFISYHWLILVVRLPEGPPARCRSSSGLAWR